MYANWSIRGRFVFATPSAKEIGNRYELVRCPGLWRLESKTASGPAVSAPGLTRQSIRSEAYLFEQS
jgi:hypothetical protein